MTGLGLGGASVASTQTGTEAAEQAEQGVVAGALNAAAQVGMALGLALTPVVTVAGGGGYRAGFIGTLGVAAVGMAFSRLVPRRSRSAADSVPDTAGSGADTLGSGAEAAGSGRDFGPKSSRRSP